MMNLRCNKPLCIQIIFYSKYPVVLFMLFWIFLVHCSSRSTIIFLIVSKEIQKYDHRKFYFFQKRNIFKFGIHVHRWKKIAKKMYNFFSVHIKYERNSRKYCEKNLRRNIFVRRKIFAKKNSIKKMFTKKKFVGKIFVKKIFRKKNSKKN